MCSSVDIPGLVYIGGDGGIWDSGPSVKDGMGEFETESHL